MAASLATLRSRIARAERQRRAVARYAAGGYTALGIFTEAFGPADDWQVSLCQSTTKRVLCLACRQSGKTSSLAAIINAELINNAGCTVAILTPTLQQASEVLHRTRAVYSAIGRPYGALADSALRLSLGNGSRAVCLSAERSLRGFSPSLLVADEACLIEDTTYYAARPLLAATQGRLICTSTPRARFGWFYEAYEGNAADENWQRYRIPAAAVPRLSAEFLAGERKALPPAIYNAEYNVEWLDGVNGVFPSHLINAAFSDEVETLW